MLTINITNNFVLCCVSNYSVRLVTSLFHYNKEKTRSVEINAVKGSFLYVLISLVAVLTVCENTVVSLRENFM